MTAIIGIEFEHCALDGDLAVVTHRVVVVSPLEGNSIITMKQKCTLITKYESLYLTMVLVM